MIVETLNMKNNRQNQRSLLQSEDGFSVGASRVGKDTTGLNLKGKRGADGFDGGNENDTGRGDSGNAVPAADAQDGGKGKPQGGRGRDNPDGGVGDDTLKGKNGADNLSGGEGNDILHGGRGRDVLNGDAGDDTLNGDLGADELNGGEGHDVLFGGGGADVLNGGEGDDKLFGGDGNDVLSGGPGENIGDGGGGDDRILGGDDKDHLFGGTGNDYLLGGGENDILDGGEGADELDGGEGNRDAADYIGAISGVVANLSTGTGTVGEAAGDTYQNIEYLYGSNFGDTLIGDDNVNRLVGREGNDILEGRAGNDILRGDQGADHHDGGKGDRDAADYGWSEFGVTVDLAGNTGFGGEAEGDTFSSIEYLYGSNFDDTLIGDDGVNRLVGREGDDILEGGAGNDILRGDQGADHHDGGKGDRDAADYGWSEFGVTVDLAGNTGFGGEAEGDTFSSIEYVYGSAHGDSISGDDGVNRLTGADGDDFLSGAGGNDYLLGDAGNDILMGGDGNDVFQFIGNSGDDTISDFEFGIGRTDRVWLKSNDFSDFSDLQNSLSETEFGTHLDLGSYGSILFQGVDMAVLVEDDFIF